MPPENREPSWSTRLLLLFGILAGIAYAITTIQYTPDQLGIASRVYYYAATAALHDQNFYLISPPSDRGYRFLYPPVVVLIFLPHAYLGSTSLAFALQLFLNIGAVLGIATVVIRGLERRSMHLSTLDQGLLVGFIGLSPYGVTQLIQGQVTLWLALALTLGLSYLETNKNDKTGVMLALPAIVKIFPGLIGLYLLRTRNWRSIQTALLTGITALVLGILLLGSDLTQYYFLDVVPRRLTEQTFTGQPDPRQSQIGLPRQLAFIAPGAPLIHLVATVVVAGGTISVLYDSVPTDTHRLATLLGTILLSILILPLDPLYFALFLYPLLILLYTPLGQIPRSLLTSGILFTVVLVGYDTIAILLSELPLPPVTETLLLTTASRAFSVILPPTIGLYLLLASCITIHLLRQPT